MNTAELMFLSSVIRKAEGTYVGAFTAATRAGDHASASEYGALADECRVARELIDSGGTPPQTGDNPVEEPNYPGPPGTLTPAAPTILKGTLVRRHSGSDTGRVMANHGDGYVSVHWQDGSGTRENVRDLALMEG